MVLVAQDNKEFVKKVKDMYDLLASNSTFAYDCYGELVNHELIGKLLCNSLRRYHYNVSELIYLQHKFGKRAYECTSLIKIPLDHIDERTPDDFYNESTHKYLIEDMPEIPGLAVYFRGHLGIYIGDSEVVEVTSAHLVEGGPGIVKTKLKNRPWNIAFKIKDINYEEEI